MNPAALLTLISELYEQMTVKQQRIEELEAQLAGPPPSNGQQRDFAVASQGDPVG